MLIRGFIGDLCERCSTKEEMELLTKQRSQICQAGALVDSASSCSNSCCSKVAQDCTKTKLALTVLMGIHVIPALQGIQ